MKVAILQWRQILNKQSKRKFISMHYAKFRKEVNFGWGGAIQFSLKEILFNLEVRERNQSGKNVRQKALWVE